MAAAAVEVRPLAPDVSFSRSESSDTVPEGLDGEYVPVRITSQALLNELRRHGIQDPERVQYYWKCAIKAAQVDSANAPLQPPQTPVDESIPVGLVVGHVAGDTPASSEDNVSVDGDAAAVSAMVDPADVPRLPRLKRMRRRVGRFFRRYGGDMIKTVVVVGVITVVTGIAILSPFGAIILVAAAGVVLVGGELIAAGVRTLK